MKILVSTIIIFISFISISAKAENDFSINGYYKSFFVAYDVADLKNQALLSKSIIGMISTRIRLDSRMKFNENISFNLSYGIVPRLQNKEISVIQSGYSNLGERRYRINDFNPRLYPSKKRNDENFVIFHNLDRAYLSLSAGLFDITIGRQAIAWGSARTINPTDVIAPYSFDELDSEERMGVDALRLRTPIGVMGELDAGYLFGSSFRNRNSAVYLRSKFYVAQTDFSFLVLRFKKNLLLGFDLARSIGGAGFWIETAYVQHSSIQEDYVYYGISRLAVKENYLRSTIGFDYSFGALTYTSIEYHYNQAGESTPEKYLVNSFNLAYTDGSVYLMGRHYIIPTVSYQITPLMTFTGQVWWNITDNSFLIIPSVEYNIAENLYLAGGGYFGIGKGPKFLANQIAFFIRAKSEFGSYNNSLFTSFRFYF